MDRETTELIIQLNRLNRELCGVVKDIAKALGVVADAVLPLAPDAQRARAAAEIAELRRILSLSPDDQAGEKKVGE
jgi:hypothetical protein